MNSCRGCGAILQIDDSEKEGFAKSIENRFCERCFRIKNYNEYKIIEKDGEDFLTIIKEIGNTKKLVILVIDLFQIPKDISKLLSLLNNPILLVLTKRDLLPVSLYEERLKKYFQGLSNQIVDTVIISTNKNYHFDELMKSISENKIGKEVYVIGYTNAGKSSMINKILEDYTETIPEITTSMLPSTTIQKIEISINEELMLIDTPGLLEEGSLLNLLSGDELKRVMPRKTIHPITYQIKEKQYIFIDKYVRIDCKNMNNITLYFSNNLNIDRSFKETSKMQELKKMELSVSDKEDVVIKGLGFFKVMNADTFIIYTVPGVDVYTRNSLI